MTKEEFVGKPEVIVTREFLEITRDFTSPKEAIREAISNSLDWNASNITIKLTEDKMRAEEELVLEIQDNGSGLNKERVQAFFSLGHTTSQASEGKIGYKGHGTKTFFNCRQIEIESTSKECSIHAVMNEPLQMLMQNHLPSYSCTVEDPKGQTFTKITIRGYNMNRNKEDFGQAVLKDYILWFTRFGSVEKEFDVTQQRGTRLMLQGLDRNSPEEIEFGHVFPEQNCEIPKLRTMRPGDWTKAFVKRWCYKNVKIPGHPGKTLDMVFYVEGDEAKRKYNQMIRVQRKTPEYGMYKVEERYGLWVCKDFIPIKRYNEWLELGKRLETKYHAFVNSQDFWLTANRGDIGNTPIDLLNAITKTVKELYDKITNGPEFAEYESGIELEQQYQTAEQEKLDFDRRRKKAENKKVCEHKGVELVEPRMEEGLVSLFNMAYALEPSMFPFRVIDFDTRKGYDALVTHGPTPFDLLKASISFVEFKFMLQKDFNHSFESLMAVVCWDCDLDHGDEVIDLKEKKRTLNITPDTGGSGYTRYMLVGPSERHNIEVFVMKKYLKERLGLEFKPRKKKEP